MTPTRRFQSEVRDYRVVNADEEWIKLLFEDSLRSRSSWSQCKMRLSLSKCCREQW